MNTASWWKTYKHIKQWQLTYFYVYFTNYDRICQPKFLLLFPGCLVKIFCPQTSYPIFMLANVPSLSSWVHWDDKRGNFVTYDTQHHQQIIKFHIHAFQAQNVLPNVWCTVEATLLHSMPWRHREEGEVGLHSFITSALGEGEWSAWFPGWYVTSNHQTGCVKTPKPVWMSFVNWNPVHLACSLVTITTTLFPRMYTEF